MLQLSSNSFVFQKSNEEQGSKKKLNTKSVQNFEGKGENNDKVRQKEGVTHQTARGKTEAIKENLEKQKNSRGLSEGHSIEQLSSDEEQDIPKENVLTESKITVRHSDEETSQDSSHEQENYADTLTDPVEEMVIENNSCDSNNGGNQSNYIDRSLEGSEGEKVEGSPQKITETSSISLKSQDSNNGSSVETVKRKLPFSHFDDGKSSSMFPAEEFNLQAQLSDSGKRRKLVSRYLRSKIYNPADSSTTDSEFEVDGKRYKHDPDFTPRKYEEQKALIKTKDATIQKLQGLNMRHQENLFKYEEKISQLEEEKSELQQQVNRLQAKLKSGMFFCGMILMKIFVQYACLLLMLSVS